MVVASAEALEKIRAKVEDTKEDNEDIAKAKEGRYEQTVADTHNKNKKKIKKKTWIPLASLQKKTHGVKLRRLQNIRGKKLL